MPELYQGLTDFKCRVNEHKQMRKVLKKWDKQIFINSSDKQSAYLVTVKSSFVEDVKDLSKEDHHEIHTIKESSEVCLDAEHSILLEVFCESLSPAKANTDGLLEVYSSEKDRIKLDTISLILWGY